MEVLPNKILVSMRSLGGYEVFRSGWSSYWAVYWEGLGRVRRERQTRTGMHVERGSVLFSNGQGKTGDGWTGMV